MLIIYTFVALTSASVASISLWPFIGATSLFTAPLVASATVLVAALVIASQPDLAEDGITS